MPGRRPTGIAMGAAYRQAAGRAQALYGPGSLWFKPVVKQHREQGKAVLRGWLRVMCNMLAPQSAMTGQSPFAGTLYHR